MTRRNLDQRHYLVPASDPRSRLWQPVQPTGLRSQMSHARRCRGAGLYRGVINLWVEDALSREYLSALWNDADVALFIGGGNEGVRAIVKDAEDAGFSNVFAVTDRDFRPTNQGSWNDPAKTFRTFVLPVREIENYLLNSQALHASRFSNAGLSNTDTENLIVPAARRLCWWAACRDVVAEFKTEIPGNFRYPIRRAHSTAKMRRNSISATHPGSRSLTWKPQDPENPI